MQNEVFLFDANTLIEASRKYYSFDFTQSFWKQIKNNIDLGRIVILDSVKNEIIKGNDKLSDWMKKIDKSKIINHGDNNILNVYKKIINHINDSPLYSDTALNKWSNADVADPWLIATAKNYNFTIVTFESKIGNLNSGGKCNNPKIPNICEDFGVNVQNLFYAMRILGIQL